jgi:hypothetical protein
MPIPIRVRRRREGIRILPEGRLCGVAGGSGGNGVLEVLDGRGHAIATFNLLLFVGFD